MFSELVIMIGGTNPGYLPLDVTAFRTFRRMHKVRSFKLVFLEEVSNPFQWEEQMLQRSLDPVIRNGLLDFLDSPPIVRCTRSRQLWWNSYQS